MVADTYTSTLGTLVMGTGNDNNTWGTNANSAVFQILEDAIANILTIADTSGTKDLSGTPPPAAASAARYWQLNCTGVLVGNLTIQVPNLSKGWLVNNACTLGAFSLKMKTPAGTAVTIPAGWGFVWCDGANAINVSPYFSLSLTLPSQTLAPNGSAAAPSYSFTNEVTTGVYLTAGHLNFAQGGVKVLDLASGAAILTGTLAVSSTTVLTGAATLSNGGTFSGTIAGAHTYSGALTCSSTISVAGKASFTSTDSIAIANGSTAQRNATPSAGDARYNSTLSVLEYWSGSQWIALTGTPRGYIDGLTLSNDGSSPNTVVDIAAGTCRSDEDTVDLKLAAFTKSLAVNWAAGSAQGGLDTGASASNSTYAVFVIYNPTSLVTDALLSKSTAGSFASPTMPAGYTKKRYIGSILTDNSGNIVTFVQVGDDFLLKTMRARAPSLSTTASLVTMGDGTTPGVPAGVTVTVRYRASRPGTGSGLSVLFTSPDETDVAASSTVQSFTSGNNATADEAGEFQTRTNTSQQIRMRASGTDSGTTVRTFGWIDQRGKNS